MQQHSRRESVSKQGNVTFSGQNDRVSISRPPQIAQLRLVLLCNLEETFCPGRACITLLLWVTLFVSHRRLGTAQPKCH